MRFFGYGVSITKAAQSLSDAFSRGWHTIYESFPGAWQRNVEVSPESALAQVTVFACHTLIASDIAKLRLKLVRQESGIWQETEVPAFSPVLRRPNRYQTRQQFIECWISSKLTHGNTVALKQRDDRNAVVALYILDWCRLKPVVTDDGSVYYNLQADNLTGIKAAVAVPASEIIHDRFNCLFHPLVGIPPLFACSLAATQALKIQHNSAKFFQNMSRPSGVLTAPGQIGDETAKRLKEAWEGNFGGDNIGKVAVLGDGLSYAPMATNAHDAQLVEQLKLSAEQICSAYHVPAHMVGAAPVPPNNNVEALALQYYSQCLQSLIEAIEACLDEGLGLGMSGATRLLGTELEVDDLQRMDTATQVKVLADSVGAGWMSPNEARRKRQMAPVVGGESPMIQQQNYSLAALAKRDSGEDPFGKAKPEPAPAPPPEEMPEDDEAAAKWFGKDARAEIARFLPLMLREAAGA